MTAATGVSLRTIRCSLAGCLAWWLAAVSARAEPAHAPRAAELVVTPGATCLERAQLEGRLREWLGTKPLDPSLRVEVTGDGVDPRALRFSLWQRADKLDERHFASAPADCAQLHAVVALALAIDLRVVLVMADLELLPCGEIASALAVPVGTVYSRLHEARRRWMEELERTRTRHARGPRLAAERRP